MSKSNIERTFEGKLKDFDSKKESKFEAAHLKAYKRGQDYFKFGYRPDGTPIFHAVKQTKNVRQ